MEEYPLTESLKENLILNTIRMMDVDEDASPNCETEFQFDYGGRTIVASVKITEIPKDKLYRDRDWLYNEYVTKGKTLKEIASIFNITPMSIHQWLVKLGIPARPRGRRQ
jgi:hypothetical protein